MVEDQFQKALESGVEVTLTLRHGDLTIEYGYVVVPGATRDQVLQALRPKVRDGIEPEVDAEGNPAAYLASVSLVRPHDAGTDSSVDPAGMPIIDLGGLPGVGALKKLLDKPAPGGEITSPQEVAAEPSKKAEDTAG